ncbi:MAG: hypothetical protein ABGX87_07540 [Alcanivorax sp.]|uniref:hypothetical protein n=1 Tax=Alloalcanivorax marinus TaxID=1177169 RepID=UPI0019597788|nr:hypothetical protein [Alloalcanivorax marinus]MBM7335594.1 hypothetical protein [Alloalcanivorax marinus]
MTDLPFSLAPLALPTLPDLSGLLAVPLVLFGMVALLLWSGRIRQKVLVNVLALGVMLPMVQLCMVTLGVQWLGRELQPALLGMLPPWIG